MDFSSILSHCRNTGKTHKINRAVSVVTFTDCVCIPSAPRALYIFQLCRRAAGLQGCFVPRLPSVWVRVLQARSPYHFLRAAGCCRAGIAAGQRALLPFVGRSVAVIGRRSAAGQLHRGRHRAGYAAPQHCFGRVRRSPWATSPPVWKLCPRGVMRASAAGRVMCFSAETDKKAFPVSVYPAKDKPFTGFVSSQRRPHRARPLSSCWVSCAAYSASLKGFYGRCRRSGAMGVFYFAGNTGHR